jgi:DNA replication and repair protein RecF
VELKWLYVRNFRNLKDLSIEFSPQMNEVVGQNAQGKTSILEAIYLCMTGSSFRTHVPCDLIRHEQAGFFIELGFEKQGAVHEMQFSFDGLKKRIFLNKRLCESQIALIGQLLGVACTPEIQNLVKGSPHLRRHFFDLQIAQLDPLYVHHLSRYKRALKQRNSLLREKAFRTLDAWEQELASSAAYITKKRAEKIEALTVFVEKFYVELTGTKSKMHLTYKTKAPYQESVEFLVGYFEKELRAKRAQEAAYGATLVGPHRDDIGIFLQDKLVSEFGSEGEMRLTSFALKLAEWHALESHAQEKPIMMIDDFGAYLDSERSKLLFQLSSKLGQVFISSHRSAKEMCSADVSLKTFCIEAGSLRDS